MSVIALSTIAASPSVAQNDAPVAKTAAVEANDKPVNFRAPAAEVKPSESSIQPGAANPAGTDVEELIDRRDSLDAEIRYNRSKIDTDRRRLEVLKGLGQSEEADRLNNSIKDSEARVKTLRDQFAQVEDELNRLQANAGAEGPDLGGEEVILPGENLEVLVNEDAAFNGRYQVRRGGYIIMPGIGRVPVAGKTVGQSERDISRMLKQSQLKRATVTVERFQGISEESGPMIYLAGEFKTPRPYRIQEGTAPTLISVLLSSGGWTDRADLTKVKIMRMARNKPVTEEVNVKRILDGNLVGGGLGADLTLTEGDVIVIPSGSLNLIYCTGRVKKAGSYRIGEGEKLTTYGAILQSGGFDHFAWESRTHILRAMPDGTKAKIPVDMKEVKRGRKPDVILQPNDIIVVPEKWFSW